MKICKDCKTEKDFKEFARNGKWYRGRCKKCHNKKFQPATGKINLGRFKKGDKPKSPFAIGFSPWNKGKKALPETIEKVRQSNIARGKTRRCFKAKEWARQIKARDGKCQTCGAFNKLDAHHIISWKEDESKRFDIENGITLCRSCHIKVDGFQKGHKHSEIITKKISESKKGSLPWNKGKKMKKIA